MTQVSSWKKAIALFAMVALSASLCTVFAETAFAAGDSKVTTQSTTVKSKKFSKASTKAGKASKNAPAIAQVKFKLSGAKGGVEYKVFTAGKLGKAAKNGKAAGKGGNAAQGLTLKLTGAAANTYDVYYRVYIKDYGWMGWAKNGAKAGTNDKKKEMTSYEIMLVKKDGGAAPDTDRAAYSDKKGFINKITGDSKTDKAVMAFCAKNKMNLKKCYDALTKAFGYQSYKSNGAVKGAMSAARFKKEVKQFFKHCKDGKIGNKKANGDCYTSAAAMVAVAKYLGYDAKVAIGKFQGRNTTTNVMTWIDNSWADIVMGGNSTVASVMYGVYGEPYDTEVGLRFDKN